MIKFRQLFSFGQKEVDQIQKSASKHDSTLGLKLLLAPTDLDHGKLLIVIPSSSGSAPHRNLARRRIKSIFYENRLYTKKANWVIIVYKEGLKIPFDDLKAFLTKNMS